MPWAHFLPHAQPAGDGEVHPKRLPQKVTHALMDAPGSCRVLVVDDDHDAADSLVTMLHMWGFTAQAVYDGAQAILADEILQPALVLMDLSMPNIDGLTAAAVLRSAMPLRGRRLVALTGRDAPADRDVCASVGFDEHVAKPITRTKLHLLALGAGAARPFPPSIRSDRS